jgi:hypothetical protein
MKEMALDRASGEWSPTRAVGRGEWAERTDLRASALGGARTGLTAVGVSWSRRLLAVERSQARSSRT